MKVSIVTPSLQQGAFLEENLRSVLEQDTPDLEQWVVDGGSTDETLATLNAFQARHPGRLHWISEPDEGQSDAINKGFQRAAGEISGWLNADDLYFPGAVSRVVKAFQDDPDVDVVYGRGVFVNRTGEYLSEFPHQGPFDADRLLSGHAFLLQPTVFWRKRLLERIGLLDIRLHYSMDYDFWCRMARQGARFRYLEIPVAAARYYAETKTLSGHWKRHRELRQVAQRHSPRRLPAITLFSWLDALMAAGPAIVRTPLRGAYRTLNRVRLGFPLDYGEMRPRFQTGASTLHFPWFRPDPSRLNLALDLRVPATLFVTSGDQTCGQFELAAGRRRVTVCPPPLRGEIKLALRVVPETVHYRLEQCSVE
jgi:glycosyltransferase involved in cell wall biosynthesis